MTYKSFVINLNYFLSSSLHHFIYIIVVRYYDTFLCTSLPIIETKKHKILTGSSSLQLLRFLIHSFCNYYHNHVLKIKVHRLDSKLSI